MNEMQTATDVARHDVRIETLERDMKALSTQMREMNEKLDLIVGYFQVAKGMGWIAMRFGLWLTAFIGTAYTIYKQFVPGR